MSKAICTSELISRVLLFNVTLLVTMLYNKGGAEPVQNASIALQTLMVSLQPQDPRFLYMRVWKA